MHYDCAYTILYRYCRPITLGSPSYCFHLQAPIQTRVQTALQKNHLLQWYLASARHIQSFEVGAVLRLVCRFGHVARLVCVCVCFAFLNTAAFVMRCVKSYHRVWWISIKAIVFQVCCDASDWFESLESDGFHLSKNQTLKKGSWSPWSTQMNSKQDPAYSSMFMSRKVETRIMKWNFMIIWNKRQSLVTSHETIETVIPWNPYKLVIGQRLNCGSDSKIRRFRWLFSVGIPSLEQNRFELWDSACGAVGFGWTVWTGEKARL